MTKKTRNILFFSLVALFILTAPLIVFYSLGWRFDWETKKITRPGIFYFKIYPKNAQIYLNGKFEEKTDFFFGSALVEDLLPQKYNVEIKKEGFHNWSKTLEIKKLKATEIKNVVLVPESPPFTTAHEKIEEFFFSPDNKKVILREKIVPSDKSPTIQEESWELKLFEIDKNIKSHLIKEGDIFPNHDFARASSTEPLDLNFSLDSKRAVLKLTEGEEPIYYILRIDNTSPISTHLDFLTSEIKKIDFNPKNDQKLFALLFSSNEAGEFKKTLNEIDLADEKISEPIVENIIDYSITNNEIYYLDNSGFIFKADFSFNQREKLNITPFSLKQSADYQITSISSYIVIKEDERLHLFNKENKSLKKISESVKGFEISSDSKKLACFNNHEVWVLFLEEITSQPQKKAGDQVFLTRFSEKIGKVFWYTNHYLIFNVEGKIKIIEIDDRDTINIVDLIEFKESEIFWNWYSKKLYVLINENLFTSEKLTP